MKKYRDIIFHTVLSGFMFAVFFMPHWVYASVVFQQPVVSDTFSLRGVSSNIAFATSTDFVLPAGIVIYSVTIQVAPIGNATSTEVGMICNGGTVAQWDFDLSIYPQTGFQVYSLSSTTPLGQPNGYTVPATVTCHLQLEPGDVNSFQHLPANIKTSGILANVTGTSFSFNPDQPFFVLYADSPVNGNTVIYGVPGSPSSVATSSLASYCDINVPYDSSDIIHATITAIPNGLCKIAAFLVVPSNDSLAAFADLASTSEGRIPFSYVYGLQSIFSSLSASSTANLAAVTFTLPDVGSTSPIGTLYPTTFVGLSTSTIGTYLPDSVRQSLLGLQRVALWATFVFLVYRRIIPHHVMHTTT